MKDRALAIGVDIGGTKILGCLVDADGRVVRTTVIPTPADSAAILLSIVQVIRSLSRQDPGPRSIAGVGLSVAGWVESTRRIVTFSPHLPWRNEPLAEKLADAIGLPVTLENDANAAAWAEYRFGAGSASSHLIFLTVGTGVGSGIVLDGRLLRGANGMAGEVGHTTLVPDGPPCACGRAGCVDMFASGRALERAYARRSGKAATGREIGMLVTAGNRHAQGALDDVGGALGRGVADTVMTLDAQTVVIGGGVSELGEALRRSVERSMRQALGHNIDPSRVRVALAECGASAGAVGAADLSRSA